MTLDAARAIVHQIDRLDGKWSTDLSRRDDDDDSQGEEEEEEDRFSSCAKDMNMNPSAAAAVADHDAARFQVASRSREAKRARREREKLLLNRTDESALDDDGCCSPESASPGPVSADRLLSPSLSPPF